MNDAEYTIKNLRSCGAGNMPWTVFPREARGVVEHVDYLEAENERLRVIVERHETEFGRITTVAIGEERPDWLADHTPSDRAMQAVVALRAEAVGFRQSARHVADDLRSAEADVDRASTDVDRLRALVERHEAAFRHICDLLNHRIGSDPLHVAATQAAQDAVMLRLQETS